MTERMVRLVGPAAACVIVALVSAGGTATGTPQQRVGAKTSGWAPAATLFSANPADFPMVVERPSVALDGHGRATAVWLYRSVARHETVIMEADWTAVSGWTPARTLTAFGTLVFGPLSLAVNARGDAVVAWIARDQVQGSFQVRASYRPAGREWEPPRTFSLVGETADHPRVGIDGRGRAVVMWNTTRRSSGAFQSSLKVVARGRSGVWGAPKIICRCDSVAAIAMNARGLALVVWSPSHGRLWERARSPSGRWSPQQEIAPFGTGFAYMPLALNAQGAAVLGWLDDTGPPPDHLTVAIRSVHGRFGRPQTIGGDASWGFDLALAPSGEATVMWGDASCCLDTMSRRPSASSFASEQVLDSGTWTTMPGALAMDAHGNTLALWTRLSNTNNHLYLHEGQRPPGGIFDNGSDLGDIGEDSYKHVACSGEPSVAMSPNGRLAIALWLARPYSNLCSTVEAAIFAR